MGDEPVPAAERSADRSRSEGRDGNVLRFPSNRPPPGHAADEPAPRWRHVVGPVLREERRRQQRTLADVADAAAVSLPYLSEVERGRKDVSSELLDAIGGALDLPLAVILERSAERLHDATRTSRSRAGGMQRHVDIRLAA